MRAARAARAASTMTPAAQERPNGIEACSLPAADASGGARAGQPASACCSILAQLSRSVTVLLKTGCPGFDSAGSA